MDCTDNVPSRYLINDTCISLQKPLVSGSALRLEGQLTVYGWRGGPCYRCIFPIPPPPESVTNCGEGGVLGVVTGVIGTLQALEVIKLILSEPLPSSAPSPPSSLPLNTPSSPSYQSLSFHPSLPSSFMTCRLKEGTPFHPYPTFDKGVLSQKLLLFSAITTCFRTVQLRPRNPLCVSCGDSPSLPSSVDYVQFCGSSPNDSPVISMTLSSGRISCQDYHALSQFPSFHLLLDVRPLPERDIAFIHPSLSLPLSRLERDLTFLKKHCLDLQSLLPIKSEKPSTSKENEIITLPIYIICHRGNDSQLATQFLISNGFTTVKDLIGGLETWKTTVDSEFPSY